MKFYQVIQAHIRAMRGVCNDYGVGELTIELLITIYASSRPMYPRDMVKVLDEVNPEEVLAQVKLLKGWGWISTSQHDLHVDSNRMWGLSQTGIGVLDSYRYKFEKHLKERVE